MCLLELQKGKGVPESKVRHRTSSTDYAATLRNDFVDLANAEETDYLTPWKHHTTEQWQRGTVTWLNRVAGSTAECLLVPARTRDPGIGQNIEDSPILDEVKSLLVPSGNEHSLLMALRHRERVVKYLQLLYSCVATAFGKRPNERGHKELATAQKRSRYSCNMARNSPPS